MFLSPCHYGCTNQTITENGTTLYSSCNCERDPTVILTETACQFRRIPCKRFVGWTKKRNVNMRRFFS